MTCSVMYTGGTVLHLYLPNGSPALRPVSVWCSAHWATSACRITITPTFSICPTHGYLAGEHEFCPKCDAELLARKQHEETTHVHA